jgi:ElaB/YqjD/DUF883 family membrane-anchored ribosome-binding protein
MKARQSCVALVFALVCGAAGHASADPPPDSPKDPQPKAGERLQEAREKAREAMKEAREQAHEAMQKVPKDTRAAMEQAREAMKEAREEAREAIEKAPAEARAQMKDAREEMQKAREQGRDALEQAKAAMDKARDQVQQALPGLPGTASRHDQARYARRVAWHGLMGRVSQPSEIAPPVREELRHHAQRMAKLQRIHAVAASKHDKSTVVRCDKLLARELTRHEARLALLLPAQAKAKEPAAAATSSDDEPNEAEGAEDEDHEGEP